MGRSGAVRGGEGEGQVLPLGEEGQHPQQSHGDGVPLHDHHVLVALALQFLRGHCDQHGHAVDPQQQQVEGQQLLEPETLLGHHGGVIGPQVSQEDSHPDDGDYQNQEESNCAGTMQGASSTRVDCPDGDPVQQDGELRHVVKVGRQLLGVAGLLHHGCAPAEDEEEDEGEEGGGDEHEVAEGDVLGVVAGSAGDGGRRVGLFLALLHSHVVAVEGRQDYQRHVRSHHHSRVHLSQHPLVPTLILTYHHVNNYFSVPISNPALLPIFNHFFNLKAVLGLRDGAAWLGRGGWWGSMVGSSKREYIILMNFRSILGKVLGGLSNLSPVRNLIKYVLDRTLNELLSEQVSIEDFKNGELLLKRITLNVEKINREYLLSSPYILHSGTARQLRVVMPNYSQLSTRSVELVLEGLHLDLQPNRNFQDNFRQAMGERQEEAAEASGPELIDSNPMDFFRQLVKQIILNMKIRIENTAVRLFINEPKRDSRRPQFYLLLRAPLISLGKSEDFQLPVRETVEEMKFDLVVPQVSAHLLREGTPIPEYANESQNVDFPFSYPSVAHPGTLLVVGPSDWKANMQHSSRLTFGLLTDYQSSTRVLSVDAKVPFLEVTVDPIQLKVLSRFLAQMAEFQRILKSVLVELGLGNLGQSVGLTLSRRGSKGKSASMDLFSSVALMIAEPQLRRSGSGEGDLYKSIMLNAEMAQAATEFNTNAMAQLKKSGEQLPQGLRQVNFKQELKVACGLGRVQVNLLKYVAATIFKRGWVADGEGRGVNGALGCAHLRGVVREVAYTFSSSINKHEVSMGHAKLHDVRLVPMQAMHVSESEEFYDVNSSTFSEVAVEQNYFNEKPHLAEFSLRPQQHYCMEELFRCSQAPAPPVHLRHLHRHAFLPGRQSSSGAGSGLRVVFNADSRVLQVQIREVGVGVNCELWKDLLNIVYPVFLYKQLALRTDLTSSQIGEEARNGGFFESTYNFSGSVAEDVEREGRLRVSVRADLIYCLYRESAAVSAGEDLLGQVEAKLLDSDNFSRNCFCQLTQRSLYAEISKLEFDHTAGEFSLACRELRAGFMPITESSVKDCPAAFLVSERLQMVEQREEEGLRTRLFFPKTRLSVELPELITFIDMLKRAIVIADTLVGFQRSLAAKLCCIERELLHTTKPAKEKARPQRVLEVLAGELEVRMLLAAAYFHTFYFRKGGCQQEVKLKAMALGLAQPIEVRLGQFKNQLLTSIYPNTSHYAGIADSALILELGREAERKDWVGKEPKRRQPLEFFREVEKEQLSVGVFVRQKVEEGSGDKKFQFKKNIKRTGVIEEEQRSATVEVLLSRTIYLHANNLAYLLRQRPQIESTCQKVSAVFHQIQTHSRQILTQRKGSIDEGEPADTRINLKGGQLFLDCRPDFAFDPTAHSRVLSPSRLVVLVELNSCKVVASGERQQHTAAVDCNVKAYFLHHADRECELNPLLLSLGQLELYGFRSVANLDSLSLNAHFDVRSSCVSASCSVDSLAVSLCLSSVPLVSMFSQHFLKHTVGGDYGMYEYECFEVVEAEQEEEEWEDLTGRQEDIEKQIEQKNRSLEEFSASEFVLRPTEAVQFHLKSFTLAQLKVELYGGQEFTFLQCESLYESKAAHRSRSEQPDTSNCVTLSLERLSLTAGSSEGGLKVAAEVEKISGVYCFRRKEGLLYWETEKTVEFPVLRVDAPLRLLLHSTPQALKVKVNKVEVGVGFTDALLVLSRQLADAASKMESSGWQKIYAEKAQPQTGRMMLVIVPEGKLTATVEMKRTTIIKDWGLKLQRLTIHELETNHRRSQQLVNDWITAFIQQNMGTIINGALFEALSACVSLITTLLRTALSIPFPFLRNP